MPKPITSNTLFYGDNLEILREYIGDASVDQATGEQLGSRWRRRRRAGNYRPPCSQ